MDMSTAQLLTVVVPRGRAGQAVISILYSLGAREQTAVDCVHNRRGADHASAEIAAVQALDGVLSSLYLVEFQVNVSLRIRVEGDMDDMSVFIFGFLSNVILQFLDPALTLFPG